MLTTVNFRLTGSGWSRIKICYSERIWSLIISTLLVQVKKMYAQYCTTLNSLLPFFCPPPPSHTKMCSEVNSIIAVNRIIEITHGWDQIKLATCSISIYIGLKNKQIRNNTIRFLFLSNIKLLSFYWNKIKIFFSLPIDECCFILILSPQMLTWF